MNIPVGTSSPEQTYIGNANIAEFDISFEVRCAADHYGGDCNTTCLNLTSCAECGLAEFTGEFCQFPTENCSEAYCNGNGDCEDGSPTCDCHPGYTGDLCEIDINECEGMNCSGNGRCEDGVNSFVCVCDPGYTGERCEDIDHCLSVTCSGNGACSNFPDDFTCECEQGFTGDMCEESES